MLFTHLPGSIHACTHLKEDAKDTFEWAKQLKDVKSSGKKAGLNFLMKFNDLESAFKVQKTCWGNKDFFNSGEKSAEILTLLLGPVHDQVEAEDEDESLDFSNDSVVPEFFGGFMKQLNG